jgi:hypothetical protein
MDKHHAAGINVSLGKGRDRHARSARQFELSTSRRSRHGVEQLPWRIVCVRDVQFAERNHIGQSLDNC